MSALFDLTGTLAVVTGARRGIGFAMAEALATAGADIIGVSATLEPEGSAVAAAVERQGRRFEARAVDFADRAAVVSLAEELADREVDILVNNAGTIERAPAAQHPLELWDRVIEVDLSSQFVLTQALGRGMLARGRGKVIFTASLLSFQGGINVPGYAAAKSGTSPPTTRRRCATTRIGRSRSSTASPPAAGAGQTTSAAPRCSSRRRRPTTSRASCSRSTAGGWADDPRGPPHRARRRGR